MISGTFDSGHSALTAGEIGAGVERRIDALARLAHAWDALIESGDAKNILAAAEAYEKEGMKLIAKKLRRRSGVETRTTPNDIDNRVLALVGENNGTIKPNDLAALVGMPRRTLDDVTGRLRKSGKIKLVHRKFYALVEKPW